MASLNFVARNGTAYSIPFQATKGYTGKTYGALKRIKEKNGSIVTYEYIDLVKTTDPRASKLRVLKGSTTYAAALNPQGIYSYSVHFDEHKYSKYWCGDFKISDYFNLPTGGKLRITLRTTGCWFELHRYTDAGMDPFYSNWKQQWNHPATTSYETYSTDVSDLSSDYYYRVAVWERAFKEIDFASSHAYVAIDPAGI